MCPGNTDNFSRRHGFSSPTREITVRYDAPIELREALVCIAYEVGLTPKPLRKIVCRVLRSRPNKDNWSDFPNIDHEVHELIEWCEWFKIYDIAEAIHDQLSGPYGKPSCFESTLNDYFFEQGIGWKMEEGQIITRGSESFEENIHEAVEILNEHDRYTASGEINEAIQDLSKRPEADITGAIQHAMAALECVAKDICDDSSATLGDVLKKHPDKLEITEPLNTGLKKLWGYSSQVARHVTEGNSVEFNEAELMVGISAIVSTYLSKKHS